MIPSILDHWLLPVCLVIAFTPHIDNDCVFPDFLQTHDAHCKWMHNMTEAGTMTYNTRMHHIRVQNGLMVACIFQEGVSKYNISCVRHMGTNTFLVSRIDKGSSDIHYSCMKFVKRSIAVVTLETSRQSKIKDKRLCSKLVADGRPWVLHGASYYEDCPDLGGFNMILYDGSDNRKCLQQLKGPRFEAGCGDDDTITVDFNFQQCTGLEKLVMDTGETVTWQRRYCTATWVDGPYTFTILTRKDLSTYWCLRFPTDHGDIFDAYLFSDVVCETNYIILESKMYGRLALSRQVVTSLCDDASPECGRTPHTCDAGSLEHWYCKKSCSHCTMKTTDNSTCKFDITGKWDVISKGYVKSINFMAHEVRINSLGSTTCIAEKSDDMFRKHANLVKFQRNGCFPRLYCLVVHKISQSFAAFNLYQGQIWPGYIEGTCRINGEESLSFKYYYNSWASLISHETDMVYVDCGLPASNYRITALFDKDSEDTCMGWLYQPDCPELRKEEIVITYDNCVNQSRTGEFIYKCLGELPVKHSYGRYVIVQETSGKYYCFYIDKHISSIMIMPGEECSHSSRYLHRLAMLTLEAQELHDTLCLITIGVEDKQNGKLSEAVTTQESNTVMPSKTKKSKGKKSNSNRSRCILALLLLLIMIVLGG